MTDRFLTIATRYLELLVSHDTSKPAATRPLAERLAADLRQHGITTELVPSVTDPAHHAGLIATWGPKVDGGIALSGHLDVVSVANQNWSVPPFALTQKDGKFYGRGTTDMKGFNAAALAVLTARARDAQYASRPVQLFLSHDEETGFKSIRELLARTGASVPTPRLAIIGEPTGLDIVGAHKGVIGLTFDIEGYACHSSDPRFGISALRIAHQIQAFAFNLEQVLRERGGGAGFEPPYSTLEPTIVQSGNAINIIPERAKLVLFGRPLRFEELAKIQSQFEALAETLTREHANPRIEKVPLIKVTALALPPLEERADNPAVDFLTGVLPESPHEKASYMTEAALFQRHGIPAAVCGAGHIAQAHTADEFVRPDDFYANVRFVNQIVNRALRHG